MLWETCLSECHVIDLWVKEAEGLCLYFSIFHALFTSHWCCILLFNSKMCVWNLIALYLCLYLISWSCFWGRRKWDVEEAENFVFAMIVLLILTTKASAHNSRTIFLTPHIFASPHFAFPSNERSSRRPGHRLDKADWYLWHPGIQASNQPSAKHSKQPSGQQPINDPIFTVAWPQTNSWEQDQWQAIVNVTQRKYPFPCITHTRAHFLEIYTHKVST